MASSALLPLDTSADTIRTTTLTVSHRPVSPATPLSPSSGDVRHVLSHIQFVAHKSANLAHAIAQKEASLMQSGSSSSASLDGDAAPPALARAFSSLPDPVPAGELDAIKASLEDIWHATVPLTGAAHSLNQASLLLRNRLYGIVRDVARYLDVVAEELQAWLGEGAEREPLTPVSLEEDDDEESSKALGKIAEEEEEDDTGTTERIPAAHVAIVLDVMLALLEASSGMLAAMSRSRAAKGGAFGSGFGFAGVPASSSFSHTRSVSASSFSSADDCKDAASRSLDRARFHTHTYRPENEDGMAALAHADRLGFRALEAHVDGLTSYLWCDFGGL